MDNTPVEIDFHVSTTFTQKMKSRKTDCNVDILKLETTKLMYHC